MTMTISTFDIFFVSLHLIEKIDTLLKLKKQHYKLEYYAQLV